MCVDLVFLHLHLVSIGWMEDLGIWVSGTTSTNDGLETMEDLGIWVSGTTSTNDGVETCVSGTTSTNDGVETWVSGTTSTNDGVEVVGMQCPCEVIDGSIKTLKHTKQSQKCCPS